VKSSFGAFVVLCLAAAAYGQNSPTDNAYTNTASAGTNYGIATTLNVVSSNEPGAPAKAINTDRSHNLSNGVVTEKEKL